jgi:uncharacterized membrane protein YedE/YeeE
MARNDERSVSDVLQDIFGNLQDIVRSEFRLAKVEITTEAGKAAKASKLLAVGGVLFLYAGGLILLAAVYGLSSVLQPWLAALLIGVLVAIVAAILLSAGRRRLQVVHPTAERTIKNVKENVQWLKDQTR